MRNAPPTVDELAEYSRVRNLTSEDPMAALSLLRDALEAGAAASMACSRDNLLDATGSDLAALVKVLADAHDLATYATDVRASAQQAVLALLPDYNSVAVEGVGTVTRRSGTQRKNWDTDRLRSLLVTLTLDNLTNDDGEIRHNPATVAQAVADAIAECAAVGYRRVGRLKEYGVNADAFCTTERGADRVEFMPENSRG